jgi:uncharacterized membrane protein
MKICAPQPAAGYASRLSNGVKSTIESNGVKSTIESNGVKSTIESCQIKCYIL